MATAINLMQVWLEKAVSLRESMLTSEVAFYSFLVDGELRECPWRGQYTSFEQLLSTTNICSPSRYASFRDALGVVADSTDKYIDQLGVDGIIEEARIEREEDRADFVARVVEGAKRQGCPLSVRSIKAIGNEIQPKARPVRRPVSDEYDKVKQENKALRLENKALKAENVALKRELETLKKRM